MKKRIEDPELIETVKGLWCMACRASPCDAHHVTSRGAGGGDTFDNLMPLCREHHTEWHAKGPIHMVNTYGGVSYWLKEAKRWGVVAKAWKRRNPGVEEPTDGEA